jgi:hypothetical protein
LRCCCCCFPSSYLFVLVHRRVNDVREASSKIIPSPIYNNSSKIISAQPGFLIHHLFSKFELSTYIPMKSSRLNLPLHLSSPSIHRALKAFFSNFFTSRRTSSLSVQMLSRQLSQENYTILVRDQAVVVRLRNLLHRQRVVNRGRKTLGSGSTSWTQRTCNLDEGTLRHRGNGLTFCFAELRVPAADCRLLIGYTFA